MSTSTKADWQTKTLGEICDIVGGGTPSTKKIEYWDGEIVWITPKDLGLMSDTTILDSSKKISSYGLKNSSAKLLPVGAVVLSSRAPIGHVAIAGVELATNQGCRNFVCGKYIYNKYLYYFLKFNTKLLNDMGSGSTFKEISGSRLKTIPISYPESIDEQKRIVSILDEAFAAMDKAKENVEKNVRNAEELFEAYLQSVFDNLENNWIEHDLGDIYDVRDGTHDSPKYKTEGYPLVTSKNLKSEGLSMDDVKLISKKDYDKINDRSRVHKGDVLFAMIGTIGNPIVVEVEPEFAIKNVALFKVPETQDSYFLRYYLDSKFVIDKMMREAKGTTQKFVGLGYLRKFKIKVPPLAEQQKIVSEIIEISADTRKLRLNYSAKLSALNELRQSLLQKAFRGEL